MDSEKLYKKNYDPQVKDDESRLKFLREFHPEALRVSKKEKYIVQDLNFWPLMGVYNAVALFCPMDNLPAYVEFTKKYIYQAYEVTDIFSFLYNRPFFLTKNYNDAKFDYWEFVREVYTNSVECFCFREIFKCKLYEFFEVPSVAHPEMFALYNSALKQADPFAKCVFLYRFVEYYHENIIGTSKGITTEQFINGLMPLIYKHQFFPLKVGVRNIDIINKLKLKSQKFLAKDDHKSVYDLIYSFGRCGVAHGRGVKNKILYHTEENYKIIDNINIVLTLICRYLIEKNEKGLLKALNYKY